MAKIQLIESLCSKKRTTIRYKGLKFKLFNKSTAIPKFDLTTNRRYIPPKKNCVSPFVLRKVLN